MESPVRAEIGNGGTKGGDGIAALQIQCSIHCCLLLDVLSFENTMEFDTDSPNVSNRDSSWPHAPVHRVSEKGVYFVTAGIYKKQHLLNTPHKLKLVHNTLLEFARGYGWQLQAWAVMSNHYHFVAISNAESRSLRTFISSFHRTTARKLNQIDDSPGRKVWFQFWDTVLTYQKSYLARLKYVHTNPVHHGLVSDPVAYPWCSAAWFQRTARDPFIKTVMSFRTDHLKVPDDF